MDIFSFLPSGNLGVILGVVVAVLYGFFKTFTAGKNSGRNEQKAKEADSYEKHISDIQSSVDAGNAVRSGRVQPDPKDPYKRE